MVKTEDEIVGSHHRPDENEFEQALGVGDDGGKVLDTLNILIQCL